MNMLYGLKVQISIGENLLIGLAEATACYAAPLPQSQVPKIKSEKSDKTEKEVHEIEELDKLFTEEMNKNTSFFNLNRSLSKPYLPYSTGNGIGNNTNGKQLPVQSMISNNNNEFDPPIMADQKALFKIELDEIYLLLDSSATKKKGIYSCNTDSMPGIVN